MSRLFLFCAVAAAIGISVPALLSPVAAQETPAQKKKLSGVATRLIEPPFVRKWTQIVGEQAQVIAVLDNLVYYRCQQGLGVLDLVTGERKGRWLENQLINGAILSGKTLYALAQKDKSSNLVAVDIESGTARILARLPGRSRYLAMGAAAVYALDETATLRAYHPASGAVLWTRQLQPGRAGGILMAQMAATTDGVYVGLEDAGEFGIDSKNGDILWHRPAAVRLAVSPARHRRRRDYPARQPQAF